MSLIKALIFVLAISYIACDSGKLFDLHQMYEQGTLLNFLADVKGAPVTTEECMNPQIFKPVKITIDPTEIIKGQSIKIKVIGAMLSDQVVNKLHLDTFYNGATIYTNDVDKKNVAIKKGNWFYDYEAAVPTFTPSGKWEIFIYIINDKQEKIHCLKAMFTMP